MTSKPIRRKNSTSKVRQNTRLTPRARARSSCACTSRRPIPWPVSTGSTATVRISARSSQITCSAAQPATPTPGASMIRNSWIAS